MYDAAVCLFFFGQTADLNKRFQILRLFQAGPIPLIFHVWGSTEPALNAGKKPTCKVLEESVEIVQSELLGD